jgi:mRNA interferase MazF
MEIRKWDVLLVNLDPTGGNEIQKTRPGIVVSPNELNENWSPITILPMTSKIRNLGFRPKVKFQEINGQAAIDQIKVVDKRRIVKKLGTLSSKDQKAVTSGIETFFK